jgi:hypothetical protein
VLRWSIEGLVLVNALILMYLHAPVFVFLRVVSQNAG